VKQLLTRQQTDQNSKINLKKHSLISNLNQNKEEEEANERENSCFMEEFDDVEDTVNGIRSIGIIQMTSLPKN
jgi:negative regulator of genetic competence, sporulation and motility